MENMKLQKWALIAEIAAGLGVIISLIFLGLQTHQGVLATEQNTRALERQMQLDITNTIHGEFISSEFLADIQQKVMAVNPSNNGNTITDIFTSEYGLTEVEAIVWWRWLMLIWDQNLSYWEMLNRSPEGCEPAANLLRFRDQRLFWDIFRDSYDPEFVNCIDASSNSN